MASKPVTIKNCNFTGIDASTAMVDIAQAITAEAKAAEKRAAALEHLASAIAHGNVNIGAFIKVSGQE